MIITNNNLPLLQQLDPLIKASLRKTMNQFGAELEAVAVSAIQQQVRPDGVSWEALQKWWVAWKKKRGYSEQIYVMTSSYMQAITWKMEETYDDFQLIVGVMRDAGMAEGEKQPIWYVAEILEYGWEEFNVPIPPRPLWRPTLEVKKHSMQTRVGTSIYWAIQRIKAQAKGSIMP